MTLEKAEEHYNLRLYQLTQGIKILREYPIIINMLDWWEPAKFHFEEFQKWEHCKDFITDLRRAGFNVGLAGYYTCGPGLLAIRYDGKIDGFDFQILLYCMEVQVALESVSKGKCSIIERTHTAREVVCYTVFNP